MALFLEILNGDLKGTRTPVTDGLTIGRSLCHITLRDSKVSSKHAKTEFRADGAVWLIDLGSSNGIKTSQARVRELKLEPGTGFVLGRTSFQVISAEASVSDDTSVGAATVTRTFWDGFLAICRRAASECRVLKRDVAAFEPVLKLKFIKGIQTGT
jgi:pSer/pThr/pTyr-binding forkhead associated (FHA) protein